MYRKKICIKKFFFFFFFLVQKCFFIYLFFWRTSKTLVMFQSWRTQPTLKKCEKKKNIFKKNFYILISYNKKKNVKKNFEKKCKFFFFFFIFYFLHGLLSGESVHAWIWSVGHDVVDQWRTVSISVITIIFAIFSCWIIAIVIHRLSGCLNPKKKLIF